MSSAGGAPRAEVLHGSLPHRVGDAMNGSVLLWGLGAGRPGVAERVDPVGLGSGIGASANKGRGVRPQQA